MSSVRYRPPDAVRWLELGAEASGRSAQRRGASAIRVADGDLKRNLRDVAVSLGGFGKTALARAYHAGRQGNEYVLHEDHFEIVGGPKTRVIRYEDVKQLLATGDRLRVITSSGEVKIEPPAYISVGRVRVPIGWSRNNMDVPYDVLIDELSARCRVNIENA